jgi:hypothetical protein
MCQHAATQRVYNINIVPQFVGLTLEGLQNDGCSCPSLEVALALLRRGGLQGCDNIVHMHGVHLMQPCQLLKVGWLPYVGMSGHA